MTLAAALLGAPLWLATAVSATPTQKISVDVRGPVALVEVTRPLPSDGDGTTGGERLLDVALPERAALVDVEIADGGKWRAAPATDADRATHAYVDRLAGRGVAPARVPFDDGTRLRLRALGAPGAAIDVRYRFAVLVEVAEGRARVRFPAAAERLPVPADVAVSFALAGDVEGAADVEIAGARARLGGGARPTAHGRATTRGAWEISWPAAASAPARSFPLAGRLVTAKVAGQPETLAAVAAEARRRRLALEPPPNVLLIVDRSRSVGLPGLAAERDLARELLEALPPATRFDALFFDRGTRRLFPMSRPATREAIGALDAEMVPDKLANGTDLTGALRDAGALLRREASAFAPRTLLAIVTDGALPERVDGAALAGALGATTGVDVSVAAFVVRPKGDEAASRPSVAALRALAAPHGGVVRELATDELDDGLPPALAALASGGDLADVRLVAGRSARTLVDELAPGEGRAALVRLEAPVGPFALVATSTGGQLRASLRPQKIDVAALVALDGADFGTHLLATDDLVALVEPVPEPAHRAEPVVKGSLDRTVVRNTLALAFMPRARACYLDRTAATPAERDLRGRVRLAIDFTRGEVGDVVVQSSTLNDARIEACLRDGAFAIEVPRTLRSDSPSTAVLNLVFRPRTPEKPETPEEAALGAQIDLVIEELHHAAPPADETPPPDRSMIPTR
ncbi:MAG TPA: hypothetical protein VLA14_09760 [Polyangia bacterium]|nr:hypothetical protein [Polyangia bacterium]